MSKEDEDWFSLSPLPEDPGSTASTVASQPAVPMLFVDSGWESPEGTNSGENATSDGTLPVPPVPRATSELDSFNNNVAPAAQAVDAAPSASPGRSVFDEDLPELEPLSSPAVATPSDPVKASRSDTVATPVNAQTKGQQPNRGGNLSSPQAASRTNPNTPAVPSGASRSNSKAFPGQANSDANKPNGPGSGSLKSGKPPSSGSPTPNPGKLQGSLEQLSRDEAALQAYFQPPSEEEFSFPCKICGTLLYASASRVGKRTHCPDCHSELTVPARPVKKKAVEMRLDESIADVKLAPVEGASRRNDALGSAKTKEILDKAAVDLERERQEIDPVTVAFDSKRWMQLIFGFLRDPGLIIAAVILGLFTAVWMYAIHAVGSLELSMMQIVIIRGFIFGLLCIPILGSIVMCALAIIPMAANQKSRVEDWPFGRFFDSIGEFLMVVVALALASVPGGILASGIAAVNGPPFISAALIMLSIWGITPILLLGMIDNGQVVNPISKPVLQSISAKPEAWGAMYFQSGFAYLMLLVMLGVARMTGPASSAVLGALLPIGCFFIANQYGVLAGRISDVTELGYDGDFTAD